MRIYLIVILSFSVWLYADFTRLQGVVTDNNTSLQWQDDYSDNGNMIKTASLDDAIIYCESLILDNGGWRLPNINELLSIMNYDNHPNKFIDENFQYNVDSNYISSTSVAGYTDNIDQWWVNFSTGVTYHDNKIYIMKVRCVRAGI